jgi:hypothetical protein
MLEILPGRRAVLAVKKDTVETHVTEELDQAG